MLEVKVGGLVQDKTNGALWIVLLQEKDGKKVLPIWIGSFEANAIAMELSNQTPPRPMTHDLIKGLVEALQVQLSYILINDIKDNTYFATLSLMQNEREITVDARPSDSIAIALRFKAPIFVSEKVMEQASIKFFESGESKKEEIESSEWIDDMLDEIQTKYFEDKDS
ncbi:MAG: bifunctional nuclease family protein [Thermodesulfobacteriota bacterium]|nr:bifunctional nuclease family protein [Thermodesulfobacteriota bacterium]